MRVAGFSRRGKLTMRFTAKFVVKLWWICGGGVMEMGVAIKVRLAISTFAVGVLAFWYTHAQRS